MVHETPWKAWQKISFRFLFWFFGITSIFCWELIILGITHAALFKIPADENKFHQPLAGAFYWLDRHIYHIGFNPKIHQAVGGDYHFGILAYFIILSLSAIAAIIWSVVDRKKVEYNKLYFWFSVYLRYTLAVTILAYSIIKLVPVQMPYPNVAELTRQYGDWKKADIFWSFMGVSPGYEMFAGACEFIAALLLLSRRTAVFGALLVISIMVNVAALNWFYNVFVKLAPLQFMLYALFLVAPYLKNIFQFFFTGAAAAISQKHYTFKTGWKKYLLASVMVLVPLLFFLNAAIGLSKNYAAQQANASKEKMYDVTTFIAKDTLPPLTTDTLRWRRIMLYVYANNMVVFGMKDQQNWYEFDVDSIKKTFTLHDGPKQQTWKVFHYTYPSKGLLQLSGKWKGKDIIAKMQAVPADSMNLVKDKFKLIAD